MAVDLAETRILLAAAQQEIQCLNARLQSGNVASLAGSSARAATSAASPFQLPAAIPPPLGNSPVIRVDDNACQMLEAGGFVLMGGALSRCLERRTLVRRKRPVDSLPHHTSPQLSFPPNGGGSGSGSGNRRCHFDGTTRPAAGNENAKTADASVSRHGQ